MKLPNLTNFDEHPTEPGWLVFRFPTREQSEEFAAELQRAGLGCERDDSDGPPFLVATRERHREAAVKANYLVIGRHRKPFLADATLRWGVIAFFILLLALALAGALLRAQ